MQTTLALGAMATRAAYVYDDFDANDGTPIVGRATPTQQVSQGSADSSGSGTSGVTVTAGAPGYLTWSGLPSWFINGVSVILSGANAPGGLSFGTTYYAVAVGANGTDTFELAASPGGPAVAITSVGSTVSVAATANYIIGGRMTGIGNGYFYLPTSSPIQKISCVTSWQPVPGSDNNLANAGSVFLILPSVSLAGDMLHVQLKP